jgi:hypothetical protein
MTDGKRPEGGGALNRFAGLLPGATAFKANGGA